MSRLTVRFSPVYDGWIAQLGGEQSDAVRALVVLGAAAIGLPGADREAARLLEADLAADVEDALLRLVDRRQTHGRHMADRADPPELLELADPFANIGIEV